MNLEENLLRDFSVTLEVLAEDLSRHQYERIPHFSYRTQEKSGCNKNRQYL